jgi:hypothetical protein
MVAVPADTPVTIPVAVPAVAMNILLLLHVPPGVESPNVTVIPPVQIEVIPVMAAGDAITVTAMVAVQPPDVV